MEPFFRVPSYYLTFQCKGPACRRPCCAGWDVSISEDEFFRLVSLPCPPRVRTALDDALKLCEVCSEEHYATLSKNWEGDCPLHRSDGWCDLQASCGEAALPEICRRYPRHYRRSGDRCTAAVCASCEAAAEILLTGAPLALTDAPLSPSGTVPEAAAGADFAARQDSLLAVLQDRSRPLRNRLLAAGQALDAPDTPGTPEDAIRAAALLSGWYAGHSRAAGTECAAAERRFGLTPDAGAADFSRALADFRAAPELLSEDARENLLVNHVLCEGFPYPSPDFPPAEAAVALGVIDTFVRFNLAGQYDALRTPEALTDAVADLFRLIGHSAFCRNALILLHRAGLDSLSQILL